MNFANLPQELMDAIYGHLDRRSWMMLSTTCKSLSYSAQRLYWKGSTVRITSNCKLVETYLTSHGLKSDDGRDAGDDGASTLLGIFGSGKGLLERTRDAVTSAVSDLILKQTHPGLISDVSLFSYVVALDLSNLKYSIPFDLTFFPNVRSLSLKKVRFYSNKRKIGSGGRHMLQSLSVRECDAVFVFDLVNRVVDLSQLEKLEICQGSNVLNHVLHLCKDSLLELHIHTSGMDNEEPFTSPRPKYSAALSLLHIELHPEIYDSESKRAEEMYNLLQAILPNHVIRTIQFTCPIAAPNPRALQDSLSTNRILFAQPAYYYVGDVLSRLVRDAEEGIDSICVVYVLHPYYWDIRPPGFGERSTHWRWWTSSGPRLHPNAP